MTLVAVTVVSIGCASMHHGRSQHVIVTSDPPGARIFADDRTVGVTPDFVAVNRRAAVLRLEKDGFLTEEIRMPRTPSAWLAGSAVLAAPWLWSGPYGLMAVALTLGVELATGAAWQFPAQVDVGLAPAVEAPARAPVAAADEMDAARVGGAAPEHR